MVAIWGQLHQLREKDRIGPLVFLWLIASRLATSFLWDESFSTARERLTGSAMETHSCTQTTGTSKRELTWNLLLGI